MKLGIKKLAGFILMVTFLVAANAATAQEKKPSGTVVIDETQIMWVVGGDIGGGRLEFRGHSYPFKMGGLKLGGYGVHKIELVGEVYDLHDVADFAGLYAAAEIGFTVDDVGEGDFWLQNTQGVKLRLRAPQAQGFALDTGVEGLDIRLE